MVISDLSDRISGNPDVVGKNGYGVRIQQKKKLSE